MLVALFPENIVNSKHVSTRLFSSFLPLAANPACILDPTTVNLLLRIGDFSILRNADVTCITFSCTKFNI